VLVRYLAVFHRFLAAIVEYTDKDDKAGMFLGGWLADALHNVPSMLWFTEAGAYHNPTNMDIWVEVFPGKIQSRAAPERLVEESKDILSAEGGAQELGLADDLADLDFAVLPRLRVYLDMLYRACLSMRRMLNYGTRPSVVRQALENVLDLYHLSVTGEVYRPYTYTPWKGLERAWTAEAQVQADANRRIAEVLLPVPQALVRWSAFDEAEFRSTVQDAAAAKHPRKVFS
jgi:hypothetical protein